MTEVYASSTHRDLKTVEKRLLQVCRKLNVTEVNIAMFHRMINNGVATNDVRNFASKQQFQNRHKSKTYVRLSKVAMQQKLRDAYSTANGLRSEKKRLIARLSSNFEFSKSKSTRIVRRIIAKVKNYRYRQKKKVKLKYDWCKRANLQ